MSWKKWLVKTGSAYVTPGTKVFLILEHSNLKGVKQKKYLKKREVFAFKPLLQEIRLKNLTIRKILWSSNI